jgi:hypothetical protein
MVWGVWDVWGARGWVFEEADGVREMKLYVYEADTHRLVFVVDHRYATLADARMDADQLRIPGSRYVVIRPI